MRQSASPERVSSVEHAVKTRRGSPTTVGDLWLSVEGTTVAYLRYYRNPTNQAALVIGDLEVREGYRGRGHAREIIQALRDLYDGETAWTSGSFTEDGYKAFAARLPVYAGAVARVDTPAMTFVRDWDAREPRWPA